MLLPALTLLPCLLHVAPAVDGVKFLVLDMTPVVRSDSSGAHFIHDLARDLKKKGIQLILCNPTDAVRFVLSTICPMQPASSLLYMHVALLTSLPSRRACSRAEAKKHPGTRRQPISPAAHPTHGTVFAVPTADTTLLPLLVLPADCAHAGAHPPL